MVLTMLIGFLTAFMWTLAFMFSSTDLDTVSVSYLPILTVYDQALRSEAGAAFFAAWLLFICKSQIPQRTYRCFWISRPQFMYDVFGVY